MSDLEFDIHFDEQEFSGVIPVFPLPEVVLFPNMLLPLHIFEPRYREMVRDAMAGEKLIGMAKLQPGWENEYYGEPPIHERIGMGKIVRCEELADGRFNILLLGLHRVEIVEEFPADPYRRARVILLESESGDADALNPMRQELELKYLQLTKIIGSQPAIDSVLENQNLPLGLVTDALMSSLRIDPEIRQELLEELDVIERTSKLLEWINLQLRALQFYEKLDEFDSGDPRLN